MSRTASLAAILCPILLCSGCPSEEEDPIAPPSLAPIPTASAAPSQGQGFATPVGVDKAYAEAAKSWHDAVAKAGNWPRLVPKLLKSPTQGPVLTNAFDPPSAAAERLALLVRYTPVADPSGQVVTVLEYGLGQYMKKNNLDPGIYDPTSPRTVGLFVLLDPSFLSEQRWLKTRAGWTNLSQGLGSGQFHPDLAKAFLQSHELARAGKWVEAIPKFTQTFSWLGTFNAGEDEKAKTLLAEVDRLCREGDPAELEIALRAWSAHYSTKPPKDVKAPAAGPHKPGKTAEPPKDPVGSGSGYKPGKGK